jgi:hypothetical protein
LVSAGPKFLIESIALLLRAGVAPVVTIDDRSDLKRFRGETRGEVIDGEEMELDVKELSTACSRMPAMVLTGSHRIGKRSALERIAWEFLAKVRLVSSSNPRHFVVRCSRA